MSNILIITYLNINSLNFFFYYKYLLSTFFLNFKVPIIIILKKYYYWQMWQLFIIFLRYFTRCLYRWMEWRYNEKHASYYGLLLLILDLARVYIFWILLKYRIRYEIGKLQHKIYIKKLNYYVVMTYFDIYETSIGFTDYIILNIYCLCFWYTTTIFLDFFYFFSEFYFNYLLSIRYFNYETVHLQTHFVDFFIILDYIIIISLSYFLNVSFFIHDFFII
jgi:hypothetical protein